MHRLTAAWLLLLILSAAGAPFPLFHEDLSFYQSFDNGTDADLSEGELETVWDCGSMRFEPGLRDYALYCGEGGSRLRYSRRKNLNFDHPGTLVFFYRPLNWEKEKPGLPRLFFWGIESTTGYISLQGANAPRNLCMHDRDLHLALLDGKRLPAKVHIFPATGKKGLHGWHMLAFTWAGEKLSIKFDNTPIRIFSNGLSLRESDFPNNTFSIGSHVHWNYLMDDFMIFKRRLSDSELNQLYHSNLNHLENP